MARATHLGVYQNILGVIATEYIKFLNVHALFIADVTRASYTNKAFILILGARTIGIRTIGMRTIGMEDNWHAENWHGGQLACGKLAWRTIGIDF